MHKKLCLQGRKSLFLYPSSWALEGLKRFFIDKEHVIENVRSDWKWNLSNFLNNQSLAPIFLKWNEEYYYALNIFLTHWMA